MSYLPFTVVANEGQNSQRLIEAGPPETDGFTSPPKDVVNTSLFDGVEQSKLHGIEVKREKCSDTGGLEI